MLNTKGTIFNIQKFSITDGTGIRTLVFMKGCPLRCVWCSNPESQEIGPEIMDVKNNCIKCGMCVEVCDIGAIDPETFDIDREKCIRCGKCADICYANSKRLTGEQYTVQEVLQKIEKDRVFYKNSGGGVTVGGGEPLMQAEFVAELLKNCKRLNIHTSIETSGFGPWDRVRSVFESLDHIFYDIKAMDSDLHRELTGVGNELILQNAKNIAEMKKDITLRIPLIPGMNDSDDNLKKTVRFIKELSKGNDNIKTEVLPYHDYGRDKYRWLGRKYWIEGKEKLSDAEMEKRKDIFRSAGLKII